MSTPTGISRRIQDCIAHSQRRDWEGALVNLFPALDKTAKKRRSKSGVAERIRSFLEDEEALISVVATGSVITKVSVNGISITDALYKFGRTAIAHEGELDPRLRFSEGGTLQIDLNDWVLPSGYVVGMCVAVIAATENADEQIASDATFSLLGEEFRVNEQWGKVKELQQVVCRKFGNPHLFAGG